MISLLVAHARTVVVVVVVLLLTIRDLVDFGARPRTATGIKSVRESLMWSKLVVMGKRSERVADGGSPTLWTVVNS